jgi:peptidoglycan/xylan/chitin deacetylase (PgdA/CDA1 family)
VDNHDGDVTCNVTVEGEVDGYFPGNYVLEYSVTDSFGNTATVSRKVTVTAHERVQTQVPSGKIIYLTFDDGPGAYTDHLLDILAKYDVKATFFVIDTGNYSTLKRIAEEGHSIGIHSVTHDYRQIYAGMDAFFDDLYAMQEIIYQQTGVTTTLMRFPGGSSNTVSRFNKGIMSRLTMAVECAGFQYFDWNVDSDDAGKANTAKKVYDNVVKGVSGRRVSVVLHHDIKEATIDAIERIIVWGLNNGYTFLPLEPSSPTAHHGVNN